MKFLAILKFCTDKRLFYIKMNHQIWSFHQVWLYHLLPCTIYHNILHCSIAYSLDPWGLYEVSAVK